MTDSSTSTVFGKDYDDLWDGQHMSAARALELESAVIEDPGNFSARLKLIGFYRRLPAPATRARGEHLLWMIENCPAKIAWRQRVLMGFGAEYSPNEFAEAKKRWLVQIKKHPQEPNVLGNGGLFLIERDFNTGKRLLIEATELAQDDDFWPGELSRFCFWHAQHDGTASNLEDVAEALRFGECFLDRYGVASGRRNSALREKALILCAQSALWLSNLSIAERYAGMEVELVENWSEKPKTGRSILGLVALRRGDINAARECLSCLDARTIPNSVDLELANELIDAGCIETVIGYLRGCKDLRFWSNRDVDQWIHALSAGGKLTLS